MLALLYLGLGLVTFAVLAALVRAVERLEQL